MPRVVCPYNKILDSSLEFSPKLNSGLIEMGTLPLDVKSREQLNGVFKNCLGVFLAISSRRSVPKKVDLL